MLTERRGLLLAFAAGLVLGFLIAGGLIGSYLTFGIARYQAEADRHARRVEEALHEARRHRYLAEQKIMEAAEQRQKVEELTRELERVAKDR